MIEVGVCKGLIFVLGRWFELRGFGFLYLIIIDVLNIIVFSIVWMRDLV